LSAITGSSGAGWTLPALSMARELEPDLVVMDVKMPKMDGITAAATIAEERRYMDFTMPNLE